MNTKNENIHLQSGVTAKHASGINTLKSIGQKLVKRLILCGALWGVIPPRVANWLLLRFGAGPALEAYTC